MQNLNIVTASDLHYISNELIQSDELFTYSVDQGDGKIVAYIDEITDAFIAELVKERPEAFVLTGDLTLNGAYVSHRDLASKLSTIEDAGIPVLVIPGNHDLKNPYSVAYTDEGYQQVYNIDNDDFVEIYNDFGYSEAVARDEASLSYVYPINDHYYALMMDVNGSEIQNYVTKETLDWVEKQLKYAKENNITILAFSHQNFLEHCSLFSQGYRIGNGDTLVKLLRKYNVQYGFSGHLHIQHIAEEDGFTEVATSAIAVAENHYASIQVTDGILEYQTHIVDVSNWAKENNMQDDNLLHFEDYGTAYFTRVINHNDNVEDTQLRNYLDEITLAYFTGHVDQLQHNKEYDTYISQQTDLNSIFINLYIFKEDTDMNYLKGELN